MCLQLFLHFSNWKQGFYPVDCKAGLTTVCEIGEFRILLNNATKQVSYLILMAEGAEICCTVKSELVLRCLIWIS